MMISLKGGKDTMKQRAILFTLIFMVPLKNLWVIGA